MSLYNAVIGNMQAHTSFKEEIRKILIEHALISCILSLLVMVLAISGLGLRQIEQRNAQVSQGVAEEFVRMAEDYMQKAEELSGNVSVSQFCEDSKYQVQKISEIYQFLNRQKVRGEFCLFDKDYSLLFSTMKDPVTEDYVRIQLSGTREDDDFWDSLYLMYDNWNLRRSTTPSLVIMRRFGTAEGYGGFVIRADELEQDSAAQEITLIITNRFDRIFAGGAREFRNDRGKLADSFRREKGLFCTGGHWYFNASTEILDGDVKVFAVYDCTAFVQQILISVVVAAVLAVIMIVTILASARTIAARKTGIMYELIDALKEVERGNLDVKLDIHSNDEFEIMGNTFNIMLGSIRHLISRHQEMSRENTLATIQALESQFNPHFLFNTLESIRYMIKFEPRTAEKMIVSLSRLLRYSIQRGDEMATVDDEIRFADSYLQIMLYRYQERLQYKLDVEEAARHVEVPRMILQPIVENSIQYGMKDEGTLKVEITAAIRDHELHIRIRDNGLGIEPQLLEELKENLAHHHNHSDHIGLYNVHRRIHLLYGGKYGAAIESTPASETVITLVIPLPKEEEKEEERVAEGTDC